VEESHEDGLLEYPVYTKPASWQGRDVPRILLHASGALAAGDLELAVARPGDAGELTTLQRACWLSEAAVNGSLEIPPLLESVEDVLEGLRSWQTWVARSGGRLVGSVRARRAPDSAETWEIGRLMVAPDLQGRGLGRALLEHAEQAAPDGVRRYWLNTGSASEGNLRRYRRAGYRVVPGEGRFPGTVDLTKPRR
jgi:tRNA (guanine37-N1)-methyltransferase